MKSYTRNQNLGKSSDGFLQIIKNGADISKPVFQRLCASALSESESTSDLYLVDIENQIKEYKKNKKSHVAGRARINNLPQNQDGGKCTINIYVKNSTSKKPSFFQKIYNLVTCKSSQDDYNICYEARNHLTEFQMKIKALNEIENKRIPHNDIISEKNRSSEDNLEASMEIKNIEPLGFNQEKSTDHKEVEKENLDLGDCFRKEKIKDNTISSRSYKNYNDIKEKIWSFSEQDKNILMLEETFNETNFQFQKNYNDINKNEVNTIKSSREIREKEYLAKFAMFELKNTIRDNGDMTVGKRFLSYPITKKWYEEKLVKLESADIFFDAIHQFTIDNLTNTANIFSSTADDRFFTEYSVKAAEGHQFDFSKMTPHEVGVFYKAYIRKILGGFISAEIGKYLVEFLKIEKLSETEKKNFLEKIAPYLISNVEKSYLQGIFKMWRHILSNHSNTEINIKSLCVIFAPIIINDRLITDIKDSLYLPKILEHLYEIDLDELDYQLYKKFVDKCQKDRIIL